MFAESSTYNGPKQLKEPNASQHQNSVHHGAEDLHRPDLNPQAPAFLPSNPGTLQGFD